MSTILELCLTEYVKDKTLAQMDLERILNNYDMNTQTKYQSVQHLITEIALLNNKILVTSQYMEDSNNGDNSRHRDDE